MTKESALAGIVTVTRPRALQGEEIPLFTVFNWFERDVPEFLAKVIRSNQSLII